MTRTDSCWWENRIDFLSVDGRLQKENLNVYGQLKKLSCLITVKIKIQRPVENILFSSKYPFLKFVVFGHCEILKELNYVNPKRFLIGLITCTDV